METTMKSDAAIQHGVSCELKADPSVDAADVLVVVAEGVVMLTGVVPSWGKRVAAKEAAHRVAGVREVVNYLRVQWASMDGPSDALVRGAAPMSNDAERSD